MVRALWRRKWGGGAELRKFEIFANAELSANYGGQVALPLAQIYFYRQGATTSSSATIAASGTATLNVLSVGDLIAGDHVRIGLAGPVITVASVNPSTKQVTLSNSGSQAVSISKATRLIDITNPPTAYSDPLGLFAIGSVVTADSGGHAVAYLDEGVYDYVVTSGAPVTIDSQELATFHDADDSMTWNHTCSDLARVLLVQVAWQYSLDPETLDSVTYAGLPMTRIYSASMIDVFMLIDPPAGTHPVLVSWSDTGGKGAAAASLSLNNASQTPGIGFIHHAAGSTGPASVSVTDTIPYGLVLGLLASNTTAGTTTATPASGLTGIWNFEGGSTSDATRTLAAAVTAPGNGSHVDPTWTISPSSRPWALAAFEVLPLGTAVRADVTGAPCGCAPYGINASMYCSLQAAIDALPSEGGVVYVPAGNYRLWEGLRITKPNVTLIGEGTTTVISPVDPDDVPIDLLTIRASNTRIYRMKFDGLASEQDLDTGTCGIVFQGYDGPLMAERLVHHCYLENVVVTGASKFAVWLLDTILLTAINCEFVLNKGTGLRIQGTQPHGNCDALRFIGCGMSNNGGLGVDIGDPVVPPDTIGTGQVGETFLGCTMELNQGNGYTLANVGISLNAQTGYKLEVLSCYFEAPAAGAKQFLRFQNCPNVTVDNCNFSGSPDDPSSGPDRAVAFVNCSWARASSNVAQGFKTEIIKFDSGCTSCIELSNRDFDAAAGVPRITLGGAVLTGTSGLGLRLPTYADGPSRPDPTHVPTGTLIWVASPIAPDTHLQASNGVNWVSF